MIADVNRFFILLWSETHPTTTQKKKEKKEDDNDPNFSNFQSLIRLHEAKKTDSKKNLKKFFFFEEKDFHPKVFFQKKIVGARKLKPKHFFERNPSVKKTLEPVL